ncbi:MAG: hypothetical protein ACOYCB_09590 [Fastidiosipilaceae bacterium]|nr:hypothetical protein [Clostridiaceae bacterium]
MVIKKNLGKILFSFYLATSLVFFSGCGKNKSPQFTDHGMPDFPIAEDGYPRSDVLMIDGNLYPLENIDLVSNTQQRIEYKLSGSKDYLEVILPRRIPCCKWYLKEDEDVELLVYDLFSLPIADDDIKDGPSSAVQRFYVFFNPDKQTTIQFKWSNINENDKAFAEKEAVHSLFIVLLK